LVRQPATIQVIAALNVNNPGQCFTPDAAVTEMLVQCHTGEIELLSALPKRSVNGLRACGGAEIGLERNNDRVESAPVMPARSGRFHLRPPAGQNLAEVREPTGTQPVNMGGESGQIRQL
jgi:hypothetical protein